MFIATLVLALVFGFGFWYLLYGFECAMNGGTLGRNQYLMPFQCVYEEFWWAIPFYGKRLRREYCEKRNCPELADTLPGLNHFIRTHVALPLFPATVVVLIHWLAS